MKVYVVISGYAYESSEEVEGVFLSESDAELCADGVESTFGTGQRYVYVKECEVR